MMNRPFLCIFVVEMLGIWPAADAFAADPQSERWVRRFGQIARVSTDRLADVKKLTREPPSKLQSLLQAHRFVGQSFFLKELSPGAHYAFRFTEYGGDQSASDSAELREEPAYRAWTQSVDACLESPWTDMEEVFYWAGRTDGKVPPDGVQYYGQVIGLRPDMADAYKLLHAHPWPGVLAKITEGNIRNYAIFWATIDSKMYLFAYFEYVGSNFDADMAAIDNDPVTQAWIKFTDKGCQLPISTREPGEWWASMEKLLTSSALD